MNPRSCTSKQSLLVKLYRFLARGSTPPSIKLCWRDFSRVTPTGSALSFSLMIQKMKHPGPRRQNSCGCRDYSGEQCAYPGNAQTEVVGCAWADMCGTTSSRPGVRASPSSSWPWTPPRASASSCSLVLTKAGRYTGISLRPGEQHGHTKPFVGPEVPACQSPTRQMQLQKLTQDPALWLTILDVSNKENETKWKKKNHWSFLFYFAHKITGDQWTLQRWQPRYIWLQPLGRKWGKKKNNGFGVSHDYRSRVSSRIPDGQTSIAAQKKQWEQQSERAVNY